MRHLRTLPKAIWPSFSLCSPVFRPFVVHNVDRLKKKPVSMEIEFEKVSQEIFVDQSLLKLHTIRNAFEKMKEDEEKIQMVNLYKMESESGHDFELSVDIETMGTYKFQVSVEQQVLYMFSPLTGVYRYYYDENESRWLNTKDQHMIDEYIVRELARPLKGNLVL